MVALKHPCCFEILEGWVAKAQLSGCSKRGMNQRHAKTQDVALATPTKELVDALKEELANWAIQ